MAANGKNRLPSRILFLRFYLEGNMRHLKGITIGVIGTLLALYLAVYTPWRTGGRQGEKDSAGGLNVAQDGNSPATGSRDVKQSDRDVRRPAKELKQRVTDTQGAKRHDKNVKRSTAEMRQDMKQHGEDLELQAIETQDDEQLIIDVRQ